MDKEETLEKLKDFADELEGLCLKYRVQITSFCDNVVGTPHACAHIKGDTDTCVNIDFEEEGYEIGEELCLN